MSDKSKKVDDPNAWFAEHVKDQDIANAIVRVRIKLPKNQVVERDFRTDVGINYELLIEQLQEQPSMFAFWSMLLAEQKYLVSQLERLMRLRSISITTSARNDANDKGYKLAKHDLDDLVDADDEYCKLWERHATENRTLSKVFGIVDSLRMKSEHLRSLAGFKRQEMRDTAGQT
jgi:hypothetical protein